MPRLDRHVSAHASVHRKDVRLMLAQGRITVDGSVATDMGQRIDTFSYVTVDGQATQANKPRYLMLNKPEGVVCATKDETHTTVIDLLTQFWKHELHIAGRLDYNSTGLVLLTNDGRWSRKLSLPNSKLVKRYRVLTEKPITQDQVAAFRKGMYFAYEGINTRPAELKILGDFEAEVALVEGRYHQIKRMFGRFDNKVLGIHRFAVGEIELGALGPGEHKEIAAGQ